MKSNHLHTLIFIESLPEGEEKSGRLLYENLNPINIKYGEILKFSYKEINNKNDLFYFFEQIESDANNGLWPLIHIECHGSSNHNGIILANNELVAWGELKKYLVNINIATRLNLFIVLSACHGIDLVNCIFPSERAPFWSMLGPSDTVSTTELYNSLFDFYKTYIKATANNEERNGGKALSALYSHTLKNGHFSLITSEEFFKIIYTGYFKICKNEKYIKNRAQNISNELYKSKIASPGIKKIKSYIRNTHPDHFNYFFNIFFMIDLFPENSQRFNVSIENCI
jgi:hypothetical protein